MKDDIPPTDRERTDADESEASLAGRILALQQEHRELDQEIAVLYRQPYRDQLQLQRLKKRKLQLKDTITRLQHDLIPDLDA